MPGFWQEVEALRLYRRSFPRPDLVCGARGREAAIIGLRVIMPGSPLRRAHAHGKCRGLSSFLQSRMPLMLPMPFQNHFLAEVYRGCVGFFFFHCYYISFIHPKICCRNPCDM